MRLFWDCSPSDGLCTPVLTAPARNWPPLEIRLALEGFRAPQHTPRSVKRAAAALVFLLGVIGCVRHATSRTADDLSHPPPHPEVQVGKYGIACLTVLRRTTPGETSYKVDDIGKQGVPALTRDQISMVGRIQRYIQSRTLRFTFVPMRPLFIVFDATDGPCADFAPGYWVLNDPESNSFYEPGDSPGFVHPIPGEVAPTPGPWMRPDRGRATNHRNS